MTIGFNNLCRCSVALRIDGGETVTLQPFEAKRIKRDDAENIKVSVRRNCDSIKEKYVYSLVVETEYVFSNVADGAEFTVTREKIQLSPNAAYDKMFLCAAKAYYVSETNKIFDEEKVKKQFRKDMRSDFAFDLVLECCWLIPVAIIVGVLFGWVAAVICLVVVLILYAVASRFVDKIFNFVVRKIFKADDDKTEFYKFLENDYICRYFADMNRTPFMGEAEYN